MLSLLKRLPGSDSGATSIEYTLIASLIALAAVVALRSIGSTMNMAISNVANSLG